MRCARVQELFSEYYDGMLTPEADITVHLQHCPACKLEYERYSRLLDELKQLPPPELPAGFHEAVMGKIRMLVQQGAEDTGHASDIAPQYDIATNDIDPQRDKATSKVIEVPFTARPGKKPSRTNRKAAAFSRRWASVAAAACVMLISLWAVRVFDLPAARRDSAAVNEAEAQGLWAYGVDPEAAPNEYFDGRMGNAWGMPTDEAPNYDEAMPPSDMHSYAGMIPPGILDGDDEAINRAYYYQQADPEPMHEIPAPYEAHPGSGAGAQQLPGDMISDAPEGEEPVMPTAAHDFEMGLGNAAGELCADAAVGGFGFADGAEDYALALDTAITGPEAFQPMLVAWDHNLDDVTAPLARRGGIDLWDIAFAAGVLLLCVAAAGMFISMRKGRDT